MATYTFPTEIGNIMDYYRKADSLFTSNVQTLQDFSITTIPASDAPNPQMLLYLRQSIPIMFCMAWEKFVSDLETGDPDKHHVCFENQTDKPLRQFYNKAIREISLIRNCIVHNASRASKDYIREFTGKYTLNQKIAEIDSLEIDRQFKILLAAHDRITTNPANALP